MTVKIRNQARRPVSIACNSGEFRHIPSMGSVDLPDVEVKANPMVQKLVKRRVLMVSDGAATKKTGAAKSSARSKSTKSKAKS